MGRLGDYLRRLVARRPASSESEAEQLRIAFTSRYHSFRLLLEANKRALMIMAEIEETLRGARPFGITFVRARCTRMATQVWQMIRHLDDLAPEKYAPLRERFRSIQDRINPFLGPQMRPASGRLVLPVRDITAESADDVGGKMANLGEMRNRIGLPVPDGFVVTTGGFRRFTEHNDLQGEIDRRLQLAGGMEPEHLHSLSSEIEQLIVRAELPQELERAILEQYRLLEQACGEKVAVAVRSSALDEDVAGASLAGQYRSALDIREDALLSAYKSVVASMYGLPAMSYRMERGLRHEEVSMCVGFLPMIDAVAGGVLYSRNPVDSWDDSIVINSAWGLPRPVVEGRTSSDLFLVARGQPPEIRHREIADKPTQLVCYPDEEVCRLDTTGDDHSRPSLTDDQILGLVELAIRVEDHYGVPQDVEWAIDRRGSITLLQSRELRLQQATAPPAPARDGEEPLGPILASGGAAASAGAAAGPVFVVEMEADALRFPEGAVLATVQPIPRWANLLSRAAAVVAEHGSVAGHLANVAREFGVPALFGVKGVVAKLEQGQTVTVDADGRTVYEGRIEALLSREVRRGNPMEGTPVHDALQGAAQHIVPLNLLDPDAPRFRAEACQTLHDITRFSHEMAVQEMFRFGRDHHFPERSSKQLYADVPMQWWVLNLDDGFKEEVEGRYIRLENIACVPMLVLWEGITAVPWEGPPPLDGRGFMSVMFGATTNTALTTGVRSPYADRNYFMLSKDYCSLSSRLGAHFCIIEALVCESIPENYVSFQFKGGAADYERRLRRVVFVKEILEDYGFRVELNEDNLIARLEGREMEYMKGRLRILGYLTIHTRQLDMVMSRPASVIHYRKKLRGDIERILARDAPSPGAGR
jgi:pyruvate,water dikinase